MWNTHLTTISSTSGYVDSMTMSVYLLFSKYPVSTYIFSIAGKIIKIDKIYSWSSFLPENVDLWNIESLCCLLYTSDAADE